MIYKRGKIPYSEVLWSSSSSMVVHQFLNVEVFGYVFLGIFFRSTPSVMALLETICCMTLLKGSTSSWSIATKQNCIRFHASVGEQVCVHRHSIKILGGH